MLNEFVENVAEEILSVPCDYAVCDDLTGNVSCLVLKGATGILPAKGCMTVHN